MFRNQVDHTTIPQSGTVSGIVNLAGRRDTALFLPQSLGAASFLQASIDTSSANFVRMLKSDGSGEFQINSFDAAHAISLHDVAIPFSHVRLETGAPTTDVRSIIFLGKIV